MRFHSKIGTHTLTRFKTSYGFFMKCPFYLGLRYIFVEYRLLFKTATAPRSA